METFYLIQSKDSMVSNLHEQYFECGRLMEKRTRHPEGTNREDGKQTHKTICDLEKNVQDFLFREMNIASLMILSNKRKKTTLSKTTINPNSD